MSVSEAYAHATEVFGKEITIPGRPSSYYSTVSQLMVAEGYTPITANGSSEVLYYTRTAQAQLPSGVKAYPEVSQVTDVVVEGEIVKEVTVQSVGIGMTVTQGALAVAGAASLGYNVGNKIYEVNPEWWDEVLEPVDEYLLDKLPENAVNAMVSVNESGGVASYVLEKTGVTSWLEQFKNTSVDSGVFDDRVEVGTVKDKGGLTGSLPNGWSLPLIGIINSNKCYIKHNWNEVGYPPYAAYQVRNNSAPVYMAPVVEYTDWSGQKRVELGVIMASSERFEHRRGWSNTYGGNLSATTPWDTTVRSGTINGKTVYYIGDTHGGHMTPNDPDGPINVVTANPSYPYGYPLLPYLMIYNAIWESSGGVDGTTVQKDATKPKTDVPLVTTFPDWFANVKNLLNDGVNVGSSWLPLSIPNTIPDEVGDPQTQPQAQSGTQTQYDPTGNPNISITTPTPPPTNPSSGDGGTTPPISGATTFTGIAGVYNPSQEQITAFSNWLWTSDPIQQLLQMFSNPMNGIIGLHVLYATPVTGSTPLIGVGYLSSPVHAPLVTEQYVTIDCGEVTIPHYYNNVDDYAPYTKISCYLPFIGIVDLSTDDLIGSTLHITYKVDVLTGACLCTLNVSRETLNAVLYQYSGNCAVEIPLTSGSYASIIASLTTAIVGAVGTVATGGALAPISAVGVANAVTSAKANIQRSGAIGSNVGAMGIKKPYLIIERPYSKNADGYESFYGFPSSETVKLGSCDGFTRCKSVHLDGIDATSQELAEIETMLKEGIIL